MKTLLRALGVTAVLALAVPVAAQADTSNYRHGSGRMMHHGGMMYRHPMMHRHPMMMHRHMMMHHGMMRHHPMY